MKELLYFKLRNCPHCKRADEMLTKLRNQVPAYARIPIQIIVENEEKELADSYDYYYVPAFFIGKQRLFSGSPKEQDIRRVLDAAIAAE